MARLILSPAGGGKTAQVQAELGRLKTADPLAKAWVLVSTERQVIDFRRRFMASQSGGAARAVFNIEYFNFYSLYRRILAAARQPGRVLSPPARQAIIHALLRRDFSASPVFGQVTGTAGFARAIGTLIDELKQCRVQPDAFLQQAATPRERELAAIYAAYLDILQQYELIDQEGEGWLALEALQQSPALVTDVALLVVDGYDQFNPLQIALLDALDRQVRQMRITLSSTDTERSTQTIAALRRTLAARLEEHTLPDGGVSHPALHRIEAPSPTEEAAAVMRAIKARLLDGAQPESIIVAVRDWSRYGSALTESAARCGVPFAAHYTSAPADNPAIAALIAALSLHQDGFRRRDVLDVLRSPYIAASGWTPVAIDTLDRISRDHQVIGGREEWLNAIAAAARAESDREDEDVSGVRTVIQAEEAAALAAALIAFFDSVTPPVTESQGAIIAWLEHLMGGEPPDADDPDQEMAVAGVLGLLHRIQEQDDETRSRDLSALKRVKDILRAALATERLAVRIRLPLEGSDFLRTLIDSFGGLPVARGSGRDGRVLITLASDARGCPHSHVYIVGLSEGIFPARIPDDPLLMDGERAALRARGIDLPNAADRADDAGLFASVAGTARDTLTLSRPTVKNGEAWGASPLWAIAGYESADGPITRLAIGAAPDWPDAVSPFEAAHALIDRLKQGDDSALDGVRWLHAAQPAFARHLARAIRVERRRISPATRHDRYSGVLSHPALTAAVAADTETRVWSASAINDYGLCPFRYLAHRLLRLDAARAPEDGMDARQRGTLMHEILERTYQAVRADGLVISPDAAGAARALAHLEAACDALLPSAPKRLGFRPSPAWSGEQTSVRRRLRALVSADFSESNPAQAVRLGARRALALESGFGRGALLSLQFAGETIRVRGTIDRLDQFSDGTLVVIDYKSGSTPIDLDQIVSGRNVQMLLYADAAEALYPGRIAGGVFWHISGNKASGALNTAEDSEALAHGRAKLAAHLRRIRGGDFRSRPARVESGRCSHTCDFYQLCRPSRIARAKPA